MQCWPNSEVPMILEVYYIIIVLCVSSSHPRLCSLYAQLLTGYPQHLGTSPAYLGTVQIIMTLPIQLTIVVMHQVKHSLTRICQLVSGFMLNFSRLFFWACIWTRITIYNLLRFFLTWHEIEIRKVRHCHDKLICNHHARVTFHDWLIVFHMFDMFVVFVNM